LPFFIRKSENSQTVLPPALVTSPPPRVLIFKAVRLVVGCLLAGIVLGLPSVPTQAEDNIAVEASSAEGGGVAVEAQARIRARPEVIWATLTDYDNLDRFIPGMRKSEVAERRGNVVIVRQQGEARLLFFTYNINVVVEATEEPRSSIQVRLVSGNLKKLSGGYEVSRVPGGDDEDYVLRWNGVIDPSVSMPRFVEVQLMRSNIAAQFRGMVDEIDRRSQHAPSAMR
jgi:ribosome-associated toxin RatA of RatAB toxin-antitoxin module